MGLRRILTDKEPALHKTCKPVVNFDAKLHKLLDDMRETLLDSGGVGLAAPQIGILRRVVLVDNGEEILELINPTMLETDGEQVGAEGCLSVPGIYAEVTRPSKIKVEYYNENFEKVVEEFDRFGCRMVQHELSHLEGNLFVDNVSPIRRKMIMRKLQAISKGTVQTRYKSKR
jgi:peptide deformylase